MATVPSIPSVSVGQKLTAAAVNNIKAACDWSISGRPKCILTASTAQGIGTSTYTGLNFDTEALDNDNMHSNATPGTVVANTAGWYSVTGAVTFVANATGSRFASFFINSTSELGRNEIAANAASGRGTSIVCAAMVFLNVGDQIQFACWQSSGGALNTSTGATGTRFTALWESS